MTRHDLQQHLSQIPTVWTVLRQAHEGAADQARAAVQLLVDRYRGAVYRYLCRLLNDQAAADDLTQDFCLALLRGELRSADASRGRFRDYVKTTLFHLVSKYYQRQGRQPVTLGSEQPLWQNLPGGDSAASDQDRVFNQVWREELLARTWDALRQAQSTFHAVLHCRALHPDLPAHEMATMLGSQLGKELTAYSVRQTLHRARLKFAELLLDEVAHSLAVCNVDEVEEELAELGLLEYCRPALEQR
jgi:RNA polymerase sigma-70 factor (ECF subfamily)